MGKALMVCRNSLTPGLINGDDFTLFGTASATANEVAARAEATEGATFSKLRANIISGGSGDNSFRFRKNAADGNQLASRAGPGLCEDASNTDVLSAGDTFGIAYADNGTDSVISWMAANVEFASGHGNFHGASRHGGGVYDAASETRFIPLAGDLHSADGGTTEADQQWKVRGYTSFAALQVRVNTNARVTTTTFRNRINGANGGLQCDFASGATGLVVDTSPADSLSNGDLIGASITFGTGVEDMGVPFVACTLKSSADKSEIWAGRSGGATRAASATATYYQIGGCISDGTPITEAEARVRVGFSATVSNLRCYLSANDLGGAATLKLMRNGSAVITLTLGAAGGAGWYENTSDTVTIDEDDELSFEIDEGTSGSITIRSMGVTFAPTTITGSQASTEENDSASASGSVGATGGGRPLGGKLVNNSLLLGGLAR